MEEFVPFALKTVTFGLITGFAMGFALKKLSKLLVFVLGLLLIGIQVLAYNGVIDIDWLSLETSANSVLDQKEEIWETIKNILMINLPFATTALAGFVIGLKKG